MRFGPQTLRLVLVSASVLMVFGCASSFEPYQPPELNLPSVAEGTVQNVVTVPWWTSFEDPVLASWVQDALSNNWDLLKTQARMDEARAGLASAQALHTPRLDAAAGVSGTRRKFGNNTTLDEFNTVTRTANVGVALGWELDVWGRIAQLNESAKARWISSELMRDATALSVSSLVAEAYFQWRTLQAKHQVAVDAVSQLQAICNLEQRRWQAGLGTELAYRQSLAELASVQAKLPQLEEAQGRAAMALQVLAGRAPRDLSVSLGSEAAKVKVPAVVQVLDTQLLLRRPDVAAAEWSLKAAYADVNATRAERYPRLSLSMVTGLLTSSSTWVSGSPSWLDTGLTASAPLWDGGFAASKADASVARRNHAKAQYHQAVLLAYRDLQEAVLAQTSSDAQAALVESELKLRQQSLALTQKSREAGRSSQYEVLSEKIKVLQAQLALCDAQQAQWLSRVHFYKAIGGSL